jgi:hypothetical protein
MLLGKENIVERFVFMYHRETPSSGLLNSVKIHELCVMSARRDVSVAHLFVRNKLSVQHKRQKKRGKKCTTFSKTNWVSISTA